MSEITNEVVEKPAKHEWWMLLVLPAWVFVGFALSQLLIISILTLIKGLNLSLEGINTTILNTILALLVYLLTFSIVVLVPWLVFKKRQISIKELGFNRWPAWTDIFLAIAGMVVYVIISSILITVATRIIPGFNASQAQTTGFEHLSLRYEYVLAFLVLVVMAPVAEEVLFRGYLFGKLKQYTPVWVAILATSLLFGALHGAWNLAIDTFALSVILCLLRERTGNLWSSILLHMIKNGIAFYILFIYPTLLTTLVR